MDCPMTNRQQVRKLRRAGFSDLEAYTRFKIDLGKFWAWHKERMALLLETYHQHGDFRAKVEYRRLLYVGMRFNHDGNVGPTYGDLATTLKLSKSRVKEVTDTGLRHIRTAAKRHDDIDWAMEDLDEIR
jgi:hypothetical protein